jgi:diguanylate cyclase (GGDEF)-like protein
VNNPIAPGPARAPAQPGAQPVPLVAQAAAQVAAIRANSPQTSEAAPTQTQPARPWDELPQSLKLALLLTAAVVGGAIVGMAESSLGHRHWPLMAGLSLLLALLIYLSHRWAWQPMDALLKQVESLAKAREPGDLRALPTSRQDELGRLARAVHELCRSGIREYHDARQLRATLDHRVAQATQMATANLRQLAMRDALTGLGNRRFLDENLEPLTRSVTESGGDIACMVLDMDGFKKVNDTLGHAAGDALLVMASQVLRASCRREDCVVRLGGDEFVVLMPDCPAERATAIYDRVRSLFRSQARVALPAGVQPDLSAGIAWLRRDGAADGPDLMKKADEKLYEAKRAGKGRAVTG